MTTALSCTGLRKRFGDRQILNGLDLGIRQGEIISLLGASGSGKTTLLRLIAGLLAPDDGMISAGGRIVWSKVVNIAAEKRRIGMIFQDFALWPHMTVRDNLAFAPVAKKLDPAEIDSRIARALELTRLGGLDDRYPSELSGGQRQRVAIARCLVARPDVILFDEPFSNLDMVLREDLRTETAELVRREGLTAIHVTHDRHEAMALSDRVAIMDAGRIVQCAPPETIYQAPTNATVARIAGGFSTIAGMGQGNRFMVGVTRETASDAPSYGITTANIHHGPGLLVIRPEDARPASAFPENQITATLRAAAYQGRCWRLTLDLDGQTIRIDWPKALTPGGRLTFSFAPSNCLALPN